jgi:purine nucleosidase
MSTFGAPPRLRLITDNDYSGDPDGLVQLAHHVLSPSCDIRGIIGSHVRPDDGFDRSGKSGENAAVQAQRVLDALGVGDKIPVVAGSNVAMTDPRTPIQNAATDLIIKEALRDDTDLPLYVVCGGSLTALASALLLEPKISDRLTAIWIGGVEYPTIGVVPPGAPDVEYNLREDIAAAQMVFNTATVPFWQVPRSTYRQALASNAEFLRRVAPHGEIGEMLTEEIANVVRMTASHNFLIGETYIYGDSPLVLLTALQSSFEPDPSSSHYVELPAPGIREDGTTDFEVEGRTIRIYTIIDVRLMFEDFYSKLELWAADHGPWPPTGDL